MCAYLVVYVALGTHHAKRVMIVGPDDGDRGMKCCGQNVSKKDDGGWHVCAMLDKRQRW